MICFETFAIKSARPRYIIAGALILASLCASPALGQFWETFQRAEQHYTIDIPPGFELGGNTSDGEIFYRLDAEQTLRVWSGENLEGVEAEARAQVAQLEGERWGLSLQTLTPQWAALSAQRDHSIMVQRIIELCEPSQYAAFALGFHIRDLTSTEPVIEGLTRSFQPIGC